MDSKRKSFLKALSWRLVGSADTFALSWIITGSPIIGASISFFEFFTKLVLYYFHERLWSSVK